MTVPAVIEAALAEAGLERRVTAARDLGGGCIHRVRAVALADGTTVVAKTNDERCAGIFEEEAAGLRALAATGTVLVPQPLAVCAIGGEAALLMTAIESGPPSREAWSRFGAELASLHAAPCDPRPAPYGFDGDNHLGSTPQPNPWCDDWVRFNADHRLGHQLRLATANRLLSAGEAARVDRVIERLGDLIPRRPKPSLLHGDLWSGNALAARDARIAVIDPACSWGDGWADIAMMRLFGGFPSECFQAYASSVEDRQGIEERIAVYQLYHVLNHVNLFGRGYVGQAMALADSLRG